MASRQSLTDFEIEALQRDLNLADGHAYQEISAYYADIVDDLGRIWRESMNTRIPVLEQRFRHAFAALASSAGMLDCSFFKICPTASNSIDIVGAVLAQCNVKTLLVEPTFDNLALILRRRRVPLEPLDEDLLFRAAEGGKLPELLDGYSFGALFLVRPNNPTGRVLDPQSLRTIADYCVDRKRVLVLDNSFRFYDRHMVDDYSILLEAGVSFIALEDTGKVWPTQDQKASLLFCSPDVETMVGSIYNEIFMCTSGFTLALLRCFFVRTAEVGLQPTVWDPVDERRRLLRRTLRDTSIEVDRAALDSDISVEWLDCRRTGFQDLDLRSRLATGGLEILPGRQFYWSSGDLGEKQYNIRIALMKPWWVLRESMEILRIVSPGGVARALEVPV